MFQPTTRKELELKYIELEYELADAIQRSQQRVTFYNYWVYDLGVRVAIARKLISSFFHDEEKTFCKELGDQVAASRALYGLDRQRMNLIN